MNEWMAILIDEISLTTRPARILFKWPPIVCGKAKHYFKFHSKLANFIQLVGGSSLLNFQIQSFSNKSIHKFNSHKSWSPLRAMVSTTRLDHWLAILHAPAKPGLRLVIPIPIPLTDLLFFIIIITKSRELKWSSRGAAPSVIDDSIQIQM